MPVLATLNQVKAALGITGSGDDALLAELLDRAESMMAGWLSLDEDGFASKERTERYDGEGASELILRHKPVTAIDSITVGGSEWSVDAVILDARLGIIGVQGSAWGGPSPAFPFGFRNVEVTYTAGYAAQADVPDSVEALAIALTKHLWDSRAMRSGVQSESLGQYSYTAASPGDGGALESIRERAMSALHGVSI